MIKMYYLYRNHDFYGFISFKDPSITHIVNQFYNSINLYSIDNELIVNSKLLAVNSLNSYLPYDTMKLAEFISSNNGEVIK